MSTLNLKSFQVTYSKMDLELKSKYPRVFSLGELIAYNHEIPNGYILDKIYKTTNKGTTFRYIKISSKEMYKEYKEHVSNKQKEILGNELLTEIELYKQNIKAK